MEKCPPLACQSTYVHSQHIMLPRSLSGCLRSSAHNPVQQINLPSAPLPVPRPLYPLLFFPLVQQSPRERGYLGGQDGGPWSLNVGGSWAVAVAPGKREVTGKDLRFDSRRCTLAYNTYTSQGYIGPKPASASAHHQGTWFIYCPPQ